jgi:hypothetical protein
MIHRRDKVVGVFITFFVRQQLHWLQHFREYRPQTTEQRGALTVQERTIYYSRRNVTSTDDCLLRDRFLRTTFTADGMRQSMASLSNLFHCTTGATVE